MYLYKYKHLGVPRIGNNQISRRQKDENAFFALPTDLLQIQIFGRASTFFRDCDTSELEYTKQQQFDVV